MDRLPSELPFRWLAPPSIDAAEGTFRVRSRYPEELETSIRRAGIRAPLLVQSRGSRSAPDRYRIVSGWGRWLRLPEGARLPAYLLPEEWTELETWKAFLRDNERWNVMEIARVLGSIEGLPGCSRERVAEEILPLLGLHPTTELGRRHLHLLDLPEVARDFVEEQGLPLRRAEILLRYPAPAVSASIELARSLRLTWSEIGETLEQVEEIASRDRVAPDDVLRRLSAAEGGEDKAAYRRALREARYPELTRYEQALERLRGELRFRVPVGVDWDPRLERPGIRLSAEMREPHAPRVLLEDLRDNLARLEAFYEVV